MILIFVHLYIRIITQNIQNKVNTPYMAATEILENKKEIIIKYTYVKNRFKSELCLFQNKYNTKAQN